MRSRNAANGATGSTPGGLTLARLRESLSRPPQARPRGDHDLNPGMERGKGLVPAAVLVPVFDGGDDTVVLFTRRAADLADHAGEISFPGGRIEPGDEDAVAAAIRETEEELGLPRRQVEIIGGLDRYETRTGFLVTPVVGLIAPPLILRPDHREVAEVLQVPLAHVLDRANYQSEERQTGGRLRRFNSLRFGPHVIWGATAGMLVNLCEMMDRS